MQLFSSAVRQEQLLEGRELTRNKHQLILLDQLNARQLE